MNSKIGIPLVITSFVTGTLIGYLFLPVQQQAPASQPAALKKEATLTSPPPRIILAKEDPNFPKEIQKNIQQLLPALQQCIQVWATTSTDFKGSAEIRLNIDNQGLSENLIMANNIPDDNKKCLREKLYGVSWPATTKEEDIITFPLSLKPKSAPQQ